MDIVFMGTPGFAIPSLQELSKSQHNIVAVVTGPDRARGRGQRVRKTAVKKQAEKIGIKIYQPENLDDENFYQQMKALEPDVFVVVAFKILPEKLLNIPRFGAVNLHASLLPKYRGPAPINWAIINDEQETGYTIFQIEKTVDTGDMLKQEKIRINETDTCEEIHDQLALKGAQGLKEVLDKLEAGDILKTPQNDEKATKAPKIKSEMGSINWQENARKIKNLINGLSPYPGAFSYCGGKRIKFLRARAEDQNSNKEPGEIAFLSNNRLGIQTGDGILLPLELQQAGRKALKIEDFINGFNGKVGDEFSAQCS
ncbi:MAG: methionyl-tRNA formyltransferase [Candidatus Marinimicrobia bacterium]|nr:methionyl-tRNA formyltransferase [Candidatus Neomarinimicrobiota bacterium]